MTIPGIGLITATALVAFVGDIHRFPARGHNRAATAVANKIACIV